MKLGNRVKNSYNIDAIKDEIRYSAKAGFDVLDFSFNKGQHLNLPHDELLFIFKELKDYANKEGVYFEQTHNTYYSYEDHLNRYDEIIEEQKNALFASWALGCKYVVMHPLKPLFRYYEEEKEKTFEINKEYFKVFIPLLEELDLFICIENIYLYDKGDFAPTTCSSAEELKLYIDELGPRFYACMDTGHVHLVNRPGYENISFSNFAKVLGKDILTLHVHDCDKKKDLHYPPYMGNIDWEEFIQSLKDMKYEGALTLECGPFVSMFKDDKKQEAYDMLYLSAKRLRERI